MPVESAQYIWQLDPANPTSTDPVSEGDNHLRMIKQTLPASFPGMSAPWTTDQRIKAADPVDPTDLVTLQYLQALPWQMPIGWPIMWLLDALPVGQPGSEYMDLDGSLLSRVDYADLFDLYGVTYGAGDGTTTFKLPDLRGQFLRVQDQGALVDPDAATRTNRGDGVTGDNVGTKQSDALQQHSHNSTAGSDTQTRATGTGAQNCADKGLQQTAVTGTVGTYSTETRPKNINVRYIIRAK